MIRKPDNGARSKSGFVPRAGVIITMDQTQLMKFELLERFGLVAGTPSMRCQRVAQKFPRGKTSSAAKSNRQVLGSVSGAEIFKRTNLFHCKFLYQNILLPSSNKVDFLLLFPPK